MRNAYHFTLYLCSPNFANVQSRQRCWLPDYEIFKDGTTEVEYTKQVLDRKIDWKQLADSKLINVNDAGLLLDYDKQSEDDQANLLGEVSHSVPCASVLESRANSVWVLSLQRGPEYAKVFIKVLAEVSTPETAQYVLAMVDKLLSGANRYTCMTLSAQGYSPSHGISRAVCSYWTICCFRVTEL